MTVPSLWIPPLLWLAQAPDFVERRLSGDLATLDGITAQAYVPSPDGARVAFSRSGVPGTLYVSSADGSTIGLPLDARSGANLLWSPDGTRLVYEHLGLYSVLADGSGAALPLAGNGHPLGFAAGGSLLVHTREPGVSAVPVDGSGPSTTLATFGQDFTLDASGAWVVFTSSSRLYSTPVDGSQPPLEVGLVGQAVVEHFVVDPVAPRALFRASARLWSTPLDGGSAPVPITPAMVFTREVLQFLPTSDGSRVVYLSDLTTNQTYELYSVPSDGSAPPTRLTPLASGDVLDFVLTPDGQNAAYLDASGHLFSVPTDGSLAPVDLGRQLDEDTWRALVFTPDSSTLLLRDGGVFSVPLDGSAPFARLDVPFHDHVDVRALAVTADSAHVLYLADDVRDERFELFRLELATGEQGRVSGPLLGTADVEDFRLAAGNRVYWRADSRRIGALELFTREVQGGPSPARMSPLIAPITVGNVDAFTPSRGRVVFLADVTSAGERELLIVPDDGSVPARRLSPLSFGDVLSFQLDPAGALAVFLAEAEAEGRPELFRIALDGASPPVRLHEVLTGQAKVASYALAPGGSHCVFTVLDGSGGSELLSAPLAGGPSASLGNAAGFAFTPDGTRVLHASRTALSVSPIDGSTPPLELLVTPASPFQASNSRAVARVQGRLLSVPLTGGTPVELNDPLPAFAGVAEFALTPDGTRVVYRADALIQDRFLLLVVPIDRSAPPRVLNAALPASWDVLRFELTPGGTHALYTTAQQNGAPFEVHAVPLAGGPAVLLGSYAPLRALPGDAFAVLGNRVLGLDGSVRGLLPSADLLDFWGQGERLLVSAQQTLLSVSVDGRHVHPLSPVLEQPSLARTSGRGVVYTDRRETARELYASEPRKAWRAP